VMGRLYGSSPTSPASAAIGPTMGRASSESSAAGGIGPTTSPASCPPPGGESPSALRGTLLSVSACTFSRFSVFFSCSPADRDESRGQIFSLPRWRLLDVPAMDFCLTVRPSGSSRHDRYQSLSPYQGVQKSPSLACKTFSHVHTAKWGLLVEHIGPPPLWRAFASIAQKISHDG